MDHRQSEPGSLAGGLGREEGIEHPGHDLGRHAVPRIVDVEPNVRSGSELAVQEGSAFVDPHRGEPQPYLPRAIDRLECVHAEVGDDLVQLRRFARHRDAVRLERRLERDAVSHRGRQDHDRLLDQALDAHERPFRRA